MAEPMFHFYIYEIIPTYKAGESDKHIWRKETTRLDVALAAIKRARHEVRCRLTQGDRTREFTASTYTDQARKDAKAKGYKLHAWWGLQEFVESTIAEEARKQALNKAAAKLRKKTTTKKKARARKKVA